MLHSNTRRPRDLYQPISLFLAGISLLVVTALAVAPLGATVVPFHAGVGTDASDWAQHAGEWTAYAFEEDFPTAPGTGCRVPESERPDPVVQWSGTEAQFALEHGDCPIVDGTSNRAASDAITYGDDVSPDFLTVHFEPGIYGFYGFFGSLPEGARVELDLFNGSTLYETTVIGPTSTDGSGRGVGFLSSVQIHEMTVRTTEIGPTILGAFSQIHANQTTFEDLGRTCHNGDPPYVAATCDLAYTTEPLQLPGLVFSPTQAPDEEFGYQVAIGGRTVAVAAPQTGDGAVNLYDYSAANRRWEHVQTLEPQVEMSGYGAAIAMTEDLLAVGNYSSYNVVFVYERDASQWTESQALSLQQRGSQLCFGREVAVTPHTIVAADPCAGAVHLYEKVGGSPTWELQTTLVADPGVGSFGRGLAIHDDVLVVAGYDSGAVLHRLYTYHRNAIDPAVWDRVDDFALFLDDQQPLALDSTTLAVVDVFDAARLYEANPDGSWEQVQVIEGDDEVHRVALAGDRLLLGREAFYSDGYADLWTRDTGSGTWSPTQTYRPPTPLDHSGFLDAYASAIALTGELAVAAGLGSAGQGDESQFAHIIHIPLFGDGFESGDLSGWSAAVGGME